jgi:hypothetical protein
MEQRGGNMVDDTGASVSCVSVAVAGVWGVQRAGWRALAVGWRVECLERAPAGCPAVAGRGSCANPTQPCN